MELPEFPGVTFYVDDKKVSAGTSAGLLTLFSYHTIWTTYLADVNNDSYPDICAMVSFDEAPENRNVIVYDYKNRRTLTLSHARYDYAIIGSADSMFVQVIDRQGEEDVFTGKLTLTDDPEINTATLSITEVDEAIYSRAWPTDNHLDLMGYSNLYADLQMGENRFVSSSVSAICHILTEEDWEAFTAAYADVTVWKDGQLLSIKEALGDDVAYYMEQCENAEAFSYVEQYLNTKPHTSIYLTPGGLAIGTSSLPNPIGFADSQKETN